MICNRWLRWCLWEWYHHVYHHWSWSQLREKMTTWQNMMMVCLSGSLFKLGWSRTRSRYWMWGFFDLIREIVDFPPSTPHQNILLGHSYYWNTLVYWCWAVTSFFTYKFGREITHLIGQWSPSNNNGQQRLGTNLERDKNEGKFTYWGHILIGWNSQTPWVNIYVGISIVVSCSSLATCSIMHWRSKGFYPLWSRVWLMRQETKIVRR